MVCNQIHPHPGLIAKAGPGPSTLANREKEADFPLPPAESANGNHPRRSALKRRRAESDGVEDVGKGSSESGPRMKKPRDGKKKEKTPRSKTPAPVVAQVKEEPKDGDLLRDANGEVSMTGSC